MNKLSIDGIDFTDNSSIDAFTIEFGINPDDKSYGYAASESIELTGDAFDFIRSKFFDNCNSIENTCSVRIYSYLCKSTYVLTIGYEDVELCYAVNDDDCDKATVTVTQLENECYKYCNETPFLENGFADQKHPVIWYVNSGGFVQNLLFLLFPILAIILFMITIIINIIIGVCKVVDAIPGSGDLDCPEFLDVDHLVCTLYEWICGTGYKMKQPLVKDIFEYHMNICGGKFRSSIFQESLYQNTVYVSAEHGGGVKNAENYVARDTWGTDTLIQLLDRLAPVFNAEYWFEGHILHFEPEGVRESRLPIFPLSIENLIDNDLLSEDLCIGFITGDRHAYGRFEYGDDALDRESNKPQVARTYDTIVEWNEEKSKYKKNEHKNVVQFSRARFMFDRVSYNDKGWGFSYDMDAFRSGAENIILLPFKYYLNLNTSPNGLSNSISNASGLCSRFYRQRDLIITDDSATLPKLLVLEQGFDYDDARTITRKIDGSNFYDTNYPMYFDEEYPVKELYQSFHYTKDPNLTTRKLYETDELTIDIDCDQIDCSIIDFVRNNPLGFRIISEGRYLPKGRSVVSKSRIRYDNDDAYIQMEELEWRCNN